jgi:hypothetical protein
VTSTAVYDFSVHAVTIKGAVCWYVSRACIGAIWEDGDIWEVCVPFGSHVHWIGAIWEPDSTIWKEDGTIQESYMPL